MASTNGGRRVRQRRAPPEAAAAAAFTDDARVAPEVPLLVRVLAGNSVTGPTVLALLNTADTRPLRRLHPAVAATVAGVPWSDMDTPVADVVAWRAALPAAVGLVATRLSYRAAAALAGVVALDLRSHSKVTDALLSRLPRSLRVLNVSQCGVLMSHASLARLTALESLDCSDTDVVCEGIHGLPPSLKELRIDGCSVPPTADFRHLAALRVLRCAGVECLSGATLASLPPTLQELELGSVRGWSEGASLAHLTQLRALRAADCPLRDDFLASLPPCLVELRVVDCKELTLVATFAHLCALQTLVVRDSTIGDVSLASLPPSLVVLDASGCCLLTPTATLPYLPVLRFLDLSNTDIGDATVASMPAGLAELRLIGCRRVTRGATLGHLPTLLSLYSCDTNLSPPELAACRARGCAVPVMAVLPGHEFSVHALAQLPDGRLASGYYFDVWLWDVAREGEATAVFQVDGGEIQALAPLLDGHRLAVGTQLRRNGGVEVWGVDCVPPVCQVIMGWGNPVYALTVLPSGCLAVGCGDGDVRVVDVDAGGVMALGSRPSRRYPYSVDALALLPGGELVSGSHHDMVRVWDVCTKACVATLPTYQPVVITVLADGRLASRAGGNGDAVMLWDLDTLTCVSVLTGHTGGVTAMAALPDGRLAVAAGKGHDSAVWLWDTRPAASAASSRAEACPAPGVVLSRSSATIRAMLPLADGRLASAHGDNGDVYLFTLPAPPPLPSA